MARDERRVKEDPGGRMGRDTRREPARSKLGPGDTQVKQMASYNPLRMDKKTGRMNDLYERGSI